MRLIHICSLWIVAQDEFSINFLWKYLNSLDKLANFQCVFSLLFDFFSCVLYPFLQHTGARVFLVVAAVVELDLTAVVVVPVSPGGREGAVLRVHLQRG